MENKKKLLDLPLETVEILAAIAKKERKSVKAYMETVLIDVAKDIQERSVNKLQNGK